MLNKLLKYEIKATARLFLPLYLTIVIFAAINLLFLDVPNASDKAFSSYGLMIGISMFVYVILMIGLVVMTLFVLIQRFYKSLLGDEGYLMFTLPVQSWSHILSKLIISMLWTIASGFVGFCSILLISSNKINISEFFSRIAMAFSQIQQQLGASTFLVGFEVMVLGLLTLASTILSIYAAIALGHLFNKYKLLASFGMYILLNIVSQIATTLFGAIFFNHSIFTPGGAYIPDLLLINSILLVSILYSGVFAAGYFFLTNYILKRKLNLE
ncbi:MAG: hypothetical protein K0R80_1159 [Clostridia bacterium]|jgi:hypothetical protein|nr:hypothetical protein [Clostridia bacterium]